MTAPIVSVSLAEVCESVRYGYTATASDVAIGPRFLRITDIVPDLINWESVPFCEIDDSDKQRFALAEGDIVVARTGATVGYAKLIRRPVDAVFASYLVRFRVDTSQADPGFVGRLVESDIYKSYVKSRIGGAAQPNANAQVLGSFQFRFPARRNQERITEILAAYDDLVENNRRRMALLEETARHLYREWFVRLRFPGHEHTRIDDGVPSGWERKKLGDVLTLKRGYDLPTEKRIVGDVPIVSSSGITGYHNEKKVDPPGVITGRYGTLGEVYLIDEPYWPLNTALYVSDFKGTSATFLVPFLKHSLARIQSDKAAVPGLNRNVVHALGIVWPTRSLRTQFDEFASVSYRQISLLNTANEKLGAARDLLLPRLMSGEIIV